MIKLEDIKIGAKVKHITYKDSKYVITDTFARVKINGDWKNCICYVSENDNEVTRFIRLIDDFMNYFELRKD